MIFLFGFGGKKGKSFVITKSLYEMKMRTNRLYDLKQKLSPKGLNKIYTTFETPEPFLTAAILKGKDKENSKKLMQELTLTEYQADELTLAKKLKCPLLVTTKQLWLPRIAKKAGVKTKLFK